VYWEGEGNRKEEVKKGEEERRERNRRDSFFVESMLLFVPSFFRSIVPFSYKQILGVISIVSQIVIVS
jgi:hypothetical protein